MGTNWFRKNARWFWLAMLITWLAIAILSWLRGDYTAARLATVIATVAAGILTLVL